jgi:hypothetical protein
MVGNQISNWGGTFTNRTAFSCSPTPAYYSYATPAQGVVAGIRYTDGLGVSYPVYPTSVPGIGYVIGIKDPNAASYTSVNPSGTQLYPAAGTPGAPRVTMGYVAQVLFIATAQLASGSYAIANQKIADLTVMDQTRAIWVPFICTSAP